MIRNVLLSLILGLNSFVCVNAEKIEVEGIYYVLNNTDNTASVAEHPGGFYSGEMTIPQSIVVDNVSYKVVSISSFAFKEADVTSVTLPNTIVEIKNDAFASCKKLKGINIPESVRIIGDRALSYTGITSLRLPASLDSIGIYAFFASEDIEFVYNSSAKPQTIKRGTFASSTLVNAVLYVPSDCVDVYKSAEVWKDFNVVKGDLPAGIKDTEASSASWLRNDADGVWVSAGAWSVYTLGGELVVSGRGERTLNLLAGMYVVSNGDDAVKIIVK